MAKINVMEELLASLSNKSLKLFRGQEVEGTVTSLSDKELVLDLNSKSDGVISTKEIPASELQSLKSGSLAIGAKLKAFVVETEGESGQVILSLRRQAPKQTTRGTHPAFWNKFITAKNQKSQLSGRVMEANKGGLVVEVMGIRGFLPSSLVEGAKAPEDMIGDLAKVQVTEVDPEHNRLIFTQKEEFTEEEFSKLSENFKPDQTAKAVVKGVSRTGVVVNLGEGLPGFISASKTEGQNYEVGQEVSVTVDNVDKSRKRVNVSPFLTTTKGLIYK